VYCLTLLCPCIVWAQFGFPLGSFSDGLATALRSQDFQESETVKHPNGELCTFIFQGTCYRGHLGEDWAVTYGTDVYAIGPGKVVLAEDRGVSWGNVLIVRHDLPSGTVFSMYAHLSEFTMVKDEVIAFPRAKAVGKTGQMGTGPHLHWEVKDADLAGPGYTQQLGVLGDSLLFNGTTYFRPTAFVKGNQLTRPATPLLTIDSTTCPTGTKGLVCSGPRGTVFNFKASGFTPSGTVRRFIADSSGTRTELPPPPDHSDSNGQLAWSFTSSCATPVGTFSIFALDVATGKESNRVTETITAGKCAPSGSAVTFAKIYAPPGGFADGSAGQVMPNGDFIVVATHFDQLGQLNLLLVRFRADGAVLWTRVLDVGGANSGVDIAAAQDGGFAVLGAVISSGGTSNVSLLLRFDANGQLVWQKRVAPARLASVVPTRDGGYLASGSDGEPFPASAGLLVKFNAVGEVLWQRRVVGVDHLKARERPGGGYVGGGLELDGLTMAILRFGANGQLESQSAYRDSSGFLSVEDLQPTADGGVVVTGLATLKLNSAGAIEWTRRFAFGVASIVTSIRQTLDGSYILGVLANPTGVFDAAGIAKLDSAGNIIWAKGFNRAQTTADAIIETPEGGYLAVGDADTNNFIFLLKVDAMGRIPGCALLLDLSSAGPATLAAQVTPVASVTTASVAVDNVSVSPVSVTLAENVLCFSPL